MAVSPKTFDSYFLDMMYVEFMKNFRDMMFSLIRVVRELMAVRVILENSYLADWAQS